MYYIEQRMIQDFFLLQPALLQCSRKINTDTALLILGRNTIRIDIHPVDHQIYDSHDQPAPHQLYDQLRKIIVCNSKIDQLQPCKSRFGIDIKYLDLQQQLQSAVRCMLQLQPQQIRRGISQRL